MNAITPNAAEALRKRLDEICGHLGAGVSQSVPEDDQIIMDHVRTAYGALLGLRRHVEALSASASLTLKPEVLADFREYVDFPEEHRGEAKAERMLLQFYDNVKSALGSLAKALGQETS